MSKGTVNEEDALDATMHVPFSYLDRQFEAIDGYLEDIRRLVVSGDFTLGAPLLEFEQRFAELCGIPFAIGVGSGTDALILSLRTSGVGPGDEVITAPNTFIATVGAIAMLGARPVFVDSDDGFVIDVDKIEEAITTRTKAIVPVHYTGNVVDMQTVMEIAARHDLVVVEDACQAIGASYDDKPVGSWGLSGCFSLHPLKNLNVWGDGGVIVTESAEVANEVRLMRNHGLVSRDEVAVFGCNSRLDTLQAVVGNRLIGETEFITDRRIANAKRLDEGLSGLTDFVQIPKRSSNIKHVYHLYVIRVRNRSELLLHLNKAGVEAKVHYPVPVHLQPAASHLGYKRGDFPVTEEDAEVMLTLPAHQHLIDDEIDYVIAQVRAFYEGV